LALSGTAEAVPFPFVLEHISGWCKTGQAPSLRNIFPQPVIQSIWEFLVCISVNEEAECGASNSCARNRQKEYAEMTSAAGAWFKLGTQEGTDMRKRKPFLAMVIGAVAFFVTAGFVFESSALGEVVANGDRGAGDHGAGSSGPTAVAGESWLNHLHRAFDETSMGKTGRLGPPSAMPGAEFARWEMGLGREPANGAVTLDGSDLYRMNCRGCHGEAGLGAPPEINSVINPVRATSATAVMERMKKAGADMSRAEAAQLAQQSKGMLLERLHHGGQDMPSFSHLREAEVNSLIAYLRELAGVRGAQGEQVAVREPRVQVGEHIVKSTCHICHSAAGPNPNLQQLYEGAIPPLSTLALRTSRTEFIRKVTHGAPILMGATPELYRGRMPVFYYLSEDEAADVYLYLTRYPPYPWAALDPNPTSAAAQPDQGALDRAPRIADASLGVNAGLAEVHPATTDADSKFVALPVLAGFIAIVVLGLGLGFTVHELKRLSAANEGRNRGAGEDAGAAEESEEHANECVDGELVA
jgi:mono/diheme cytochrome c family protein